MKIGIIGKDGRSSAISRALAASPRVERVECLSEWKNESPTDAAQRVLRSVEDFHPTFVVVGPEEPLAAGIVDLLEEKGIPCIGPSQVLAAIESSKSFARNLLEEFGIQGNPKFRIFDSMDGVEAFLESLPGFVVKPDGLTSGKGVKVSDVHLFSLSEGMAYCESLINEGGRVIIEEKLEGEEFSLMSFCDGSHIQDMVVVQDHKRVGVDDTGPNTGGMGSYSCENHGMPFASRSDILDASEINKLVLSALYKKTGKKYKGILYGGFMVTRDGIRLIEYNARFGDPEALNVLSILETDLVEIFEAMIQERLDEIKISFRRMATVCKYVVPEGYPDAPIRNAEIDLRNVPAESDRLKIFDAAIERSDGRTILTGSRAIAFVGIGKDLSEAERIAEEAASAVIGPVYHRSDIGTESLVRKRIDHMAALKDEVPESRYAG